MVDLAIGQEVRQRVAAFEDKIDLKTKVLCPYVPM